MIIVQVANQKIAQPFSKFCAFFLAHSFLILLSFKYNFFRSTIDFVFKFYFLYKIKKRKP